MNKVEIKKQAKEMLEDLCEVGDLNLLVRKNQNNFILFCELMSNSQETIFNKYREVFEMVINGRLENYPNDALCLVKITALSDETVITKVLDLNKFGKVG